MLTVSDRASESTFLPYLSTIRAPVCPPNIWTRSGSYVAASTTSRSMRTAFDAYRCPLSTNSVAVPTKDAHDLDWGKHKGSSRVGSGLRHDAFSSAMKYRTKASAPALSLVLAASGRPAGKAGPALVPVVLGAVDVGVALVVVVGTTALVSVGAGSLPVQAARAATASASPAAAHVILWCLSTTLVPCSANLCPAHRA